MANIRSCREGGEFPVCAFEREGYWDLYPAALQHHLLREFSSWFPWASKSDRKGTYPQKQRESLSRAGPHPVS